MQAHKRVGGLHIGNTLLKIGVAVFEKNESFQKRLKKIKTPDPNNIFIKLVFYQTGVINIFFPKAIIRLRPNFQRTYYEEDIVSIPILT